MVNHNFSQIQWEDIIAREMVQFESNNSRSKFLFQEALKYLPGGNTRILHYFDPFPVFIDRAEGCVVTDVDGNSRIDFHNNATVLILGHADPSVVSAVADQIRRGASFHGPTENIAELAKILCERVPSIESVRFTNSGTEATRLAIEIAKAFTGKSKIAKIEGGYHGCNEYNVSVHPELELAGDPLEPLAVPDSQGISREFLDNIILLPFNNLNAAERLLKKHKDELSGVIVEPMLGAGGVIPADREYLMGLRELTRAQDMLLIFDEVQTFRFSLGGAQQFYNVVPDLTALGKLIGGGYPVGAVGGKTQIMALLDSTQGKPRISHHGTFNGNPVTMAAGVATLNKLTPQIYEDLAAKGTMIRNGLANIFQHYGIAAQVTGEASFFKIHSKPGKIYDYRSAAEDTNLDLEKAIFLYLINRGINISATIKGVTSLPMTGQEINVLLNTLEDLFKSVRS
jgi:glutamate-1-semialdehyde 2,1-aminomutase